MKWKWSNRGENTKTIQSNKDCGGYGATFQQWMPFKNPENTVKAAKANARKK